MRLLPLLDDNYNKQIMSNNHIVIMAGGVGSRFWPLSTPEYPKQFIDILGVATRLYNSQLTVSKVSVLLITSG